MKIFLDTNVLIDLICEREGYPLARKIFEKYQNKDLSGIYVSYLTIANSAFIFKKGRRMDDVRVCINNLMHICCVLPMNDMQIYDALTCKSPDFEDSLQIMCAEQKECDVILTNNVTHFKDYTDIPVLTPADFLSHASSTPARL